MNRSLPPAAQNPLIAVIGATGKQGGSVVDALLDQAFGVRALVRDPGSPAAHALQARGVDLVKGNLTDSASLDSLQRGADGVFAMSTPVDGTDVEVAAEFRAKLRDTFGFETDMKHFAIFGRCKDCAKARENATGKTSAESSTTES